MRPKLPTRQGRAGMPALAGEMAGKNAYSTRQGRAGMPALAGEMAGKNAYSTRQGAGTDARKEMRSSIRAQTWNFYDG